jgi:hypothetical protein
MGFHRLSERLFRTFGEVMSSASMSVNANITWNNELAFGIDDFRTFHRQVTIGHFQNFTVSDQY